ncbi:hypothetical protein [Halobaculum marinum]|uniref:Uncharacterized protein n=1 Tax=Halobaculum marinum TaxID=3031996 RepID=A0ABD5WVX3_9EURY|nr:hypothetical protein [Halobaculum sp. DT55]
MSVRTDAPASTVQHNRAVARVLATVALAVPLTAILAGLGVVAVFLGLVVSAGCLASAVAVVGDDGPDYDVASTHE